MLHWLGLFFDDIKGFIAAAFQYLFDLLHQLFFWVWDNVQLGALMEHLAMR